MPVGFGGSPGLSILSGAAEGLVKKREAEQEAQRQAILNRMRERQTEALGQDMRLQAEDAEQKRKELERRQRDGEQAAGVLKNYAVERLGVPASVGERLSIGAIERIAGVRQQGANLEQTESSTDVNQLVGQLRARELARLRDQDKALRLLGNPHFAEIADLEGMSPATRFGAVKGALANAGVDASDAEIKSALGVVSGMKNQAAVISGREARADAARSRADSEGGGSSTSPVALQTFIQRGIDRFGSEEDFLANVESRLAKMDPDDPDRRILEAVRARLSEDG